MIDILGTQWPYFDLYLALLILWGQVSLARQVIKAYRYTKRKASAFIDKHDELNSNS